MEKDLSIIAALAEQNWADNWNFRSYLLQEVEPSEIDRRVQALNLKVSAGIDCTACGNCCAQLRPHLVRADLDELAGALGKSAIDLQETYLHAETDGTYTFAALPCPLWVDRRCSVYANRPGDCREYPHLHKADFLSRSVSMIENYRYCPIVFNVYEQLKEQFPYQPTLDYIGDSDPDTVG